MASIEYHKIVNFTTYGNLGISNNVIAEITRQAVNDCEGAAMADSHSRLFGKKDTVVCKFSKKGELTIDVHIKIKIGYNVSETSARVQEKIEHDLLYMTEIRPRRIHVIVSDVK